MAVRVIFMPSVIMEDSNGNLYAIKHDGTVKWDYPTGGIIESSPAIGADGTVYEDQTTDISMRYTEGIPKNCNKQQGQTYGSALPLKKK